MSVTELKPARRDMPVLKAVAAVALWQTGRFRTDEIATPLSVHEGDVERILHAAREAQA